MPLGHLQLRGSVLLQDARLRRGCNSARSWQRQMILCQLDRGDLRSSVDETGRQQQCCSNTRGTTPPCQLNLQDWAAAFGYTYTAGTAAYAQTFNHTRTNMAAVHRSGGHQSTNAPHCPTANLRRTTLESWLQGQPGHSLGSVAGKVRACRKSSWPHHQLKPPSIGWQQARSHLTGTREVGMSCERELEGMFTGLLMCQVLLHSCKYTRTDTFSYWLPCMCCLQMHLAHMGLNNVPAAHQLHLISMS